VPGNTGDAAQRETISVHAFGFKSMNIVYSPAAIVLPAMTSGTSVFSRVETFAPARHTGALSFSIFPYVAPDPQSSRPRLSGRPYRISIHLPP